MADPNTESHLQCVNRFIALANTMKGEGIDTNIVSGSLMTASGLYASYVAGGNAGGLTDSGVEKVSAVYKRELERIQQIKKDGGVE
ncbi:MAG: hypothetical protein ACI9JM_000080 [Halioglobus sp.]|jgi:hypothetical protein